MSAVVVATLLVLLGAITLGVGGDLRIQVGELREARQRAELLAAARGGVAAARALLAEDANGWDALGDRWASELALRRIRVGAAFATVGHDGGEGADTRFGVVDEERHFPAERVDVSTSRLGAHFISTASSGRVNVNTAPREVLDACDVPPAISDWIVARRRGPDGREGSADDRPFRSLADLESVFGEEWLGADDAGSFRVQLERGGLSVRSSHFRIRSRGFDGDGGPVCEIEALVVREKGRTVVRGWRESWIN